MRFCHTSSIKWLTMKDRTGILCKTMQQHICKQFYGCIRWCLQQTNYKSRVIASIITQFKSLRFLFVGTLKENVYVNNPCILFGRTSRKYWASNFHYSCFQTQILIMRGKLRARGSPLWNYSINYVKLKLQRKGRRWMTGCCRRCLQELCHASYSVQRNY